MMRKASLHGTIFKGSSPGDVLVKAGHIISVAMLRDPPGAKERDSYEHRRFPADHELASLIKACAAAGKFECQFGRFDRVQIATPADLFHNNPPKLPPLVGINRKAARVETRTSNQPGAQGSLVE